MGEYNVVVGVANPETVIRLIRLGCIMTTEYRGRVTAVTVVEIEDQELPGDSEHHDRMTLGYDLLHAAEDVARACNARLECRIAVGRPVGEVLAEVAEAEAARLIIVGYSEADGSPPHDASFDRLIDEIAKHAPCDLLVAKFRGPERYERVLVPVMQRLNMDIRRDFLTALHNQLGTRVEVVHFAPSEAEGLARHEEFAAWLAERGVCDWVELSVRVHPDPAEAIVAATADYDAVVLGTAPLYEVRRRYFGALPDHVANHAACTAFLLRPHVIHPEY